MIKHAWKASDEDEEKFQREILGEEPNLIKLYLQQRGDRNSWNGHSLSQGDTSETEGSYSEEPGNKVSHIRMPVTIQQNEVFCNKEIASGKTQFVHINALDLIPKYLDNNCIEV